MSLNAENKGLSEQLRHKPRHKIAYEHPSSLRSLALLVTLSPFAHRGFCAILSAPAGLLGRNGVRRSGTFGWGEAERWYNWIKKGLR